MTSRESDSLSFHQVMKDLKVGRQKLTDILNKLHVGELPTETVEYNPSKVIPSEILDKVQRRLNAIPADSVDLYKKYGFVTASEMGEQLGLTKASTFRYLNAIHPRWKNEFANATQGKRRVVLLPPSIQEDIERYHILGPERQMLAVWRSMRQRNTLPTIDVELKNFIETNNDFLVLIFVNNDAHAIKAFSAHRYSTQPPILSKRPRFPTEEEYQKMTQSIYWWKIATKIAANNDIIRLSEQDTTMFDEFTDRARANLIALNLIFAHVATDAVNKKIKNDFNRGKRKNIDEPDYYFYQGLLSQAFRRICQEMPVIIQSGLPLSNIEKILIEDIQMLFALEKHS